MRRRNGACSCGSGERFKNCCGSYKDGPDPHASISDHDLLEALKRADDDGLTAGESPSARSIMNIGRALTTFGIGSFVLMGSNAPTIVTRAKRLNDSLFVPQALLGGAMHTGAYLFRDMFCQVYAPIAFGTTKIDIWQMVDLTDIQKQWLASSESDLACLVDQATDLLDFGYGWQEFGHQSNLDTRGNDLIWRAHAQLEAAATTATNGSSYHGTIQSSLLGTELALKAGLAALGTQDNELKDIGHNLKLAAKNLGKLKQDFDVDRVCRTLAKFPNFVDSRYNLPTPSSTETGHILMGAQYIASEVTRRFSERDVRRGNHEAPSRRYPA